MENTRKKRKTVADINAEYKSFVEMVAEKKPELEIMISLNLSKIQLEKHLLRALQDGAIIASDLTPQYELVNVKSLPAPILSLMDSLPANDGKRFVKVEPAGEGVFLTYFNPNRLGPIDNEDVITN